MCFDAILQYIKTCKRLKFPDMYVTLHKKQTYEHVSGKDTLYCTINQKTISYFISRHDNVVNRQTVTNYCNIHIIVIVSFHVLLYTFSKNCIEFCNLMY